MRDAIREFAWFWPWLLVCLLDAMLRARWTDHLRDAIERQF
jgi:hypothetical protein